MIEFLKGKKTYLIAILIGIASTFHYLGYIDTQAYTAILGLLGAGGFASLRAGISKEQ